MSKRPVPEADLFKEALEEAKASLAKAEARLLKLEKEATDFAKANADQQWAIFLKRWNYKDPVMACNGLRISQMLRDPAYDCVLTASNLSSVYDEWQSTNLAAFHLSGYEEVLGDE